MNNFIKVLAEEVLKEDFGIKTLALKFFNKHPTLLKQIQKLACKQSIPQIKLSNYDYFIIKEIYINKNIEKAKQLINSRYKPGNKKFGELMGLINVNEAKNNAFLAIGFALALGAGLLSGCANPLAGGEEKYNHISGTEDMNDEYPGLSESTLMYSIMHEVYYEAFRYILDNYYSEYIPITTTSGENLLRSGWIKIINLLYKENDEYKTSGIVILVNYEDPEKPSWFIKEKYIKNVSEKEILEIKNKYLKSNN